MKYLLTILISIFLVACAANTKKIPGTDLDLKVFEMNIQKKNLSERSLSELERETGALNRYAGSWPPRFKDENQRQNTYEQWLSIVADAEAYSPTSTEKEKVYYVLAELYRQGHNMDVRGAAEKAESNLKLCLSSFPKSIPCHFSSSYFYLSISLSPENLAKAEKSLDILRLHFQPDLNSEVEGGYVFLYLYQRDVEKAKAQIDKYIEHFPTSKRTEDFSIIKANMGEEIGIKRH